MAVLGNPNLVGMFTADRTAAPGEMWGIDTPGIMPMLEEYIDTLVRFGIRVQTHLATTVPVAPLRGSFTITKQMEGPIEVQPLEYGKIMPSTTYQAGEFSLRVGGPITVKIAQTTLDQLMDPTKSRTWMEKMSRAMALVREGAAIKKAIDAACTSVYYSTIGSSALVYRDGISTTHPWYNSTLSRRVAGEDFKGGSFVQLANTGEEYDPDALFDALNTLIMDMAKKGIDIERGNGYFMMHPAVYRTLSDNEKLTHAFWSPGNDNKGNPLGMSIRGIPVKTSIYMPSINDVGRRHKMSEAVNGFEYDVDAIAASCVILYYQQGVLLQPTIMDQQTVMAANKEGKTSSVEVWSHIGYGVDEPAYAGGVFRADYGTAPDVNGKMMFDSNATTTLQRLQSTIGRM